MKGRSCPEAWVSLVPERVCGQPSERSDTRAAVPLQLRASRSVEAPLRTPRALQPGDPSVGKSHLVSHVHPEQFELSLSLFDGFKMRQNPSSTNKHYRYVVDLGNSRPLPLSRQPMKPCIIETEQLPVASSTLRKLPKSTRNR